MPGMQQAHAGREVRPNRLRVSNHGMVLPLLQRELGRGEYDTPGPGAQGETGMNAVDWIGLSCLTAIVVMAFIQGLRGL